MLFSGSLVPDLQEEITPEMVISTVKAEMSNTQKMGF